ncbi:MAG: adenylate/guanylate cyclase domain-containing protein [Byssovorax sp.]
MQAPRNSPETPRDKGPAGARDEPSPGLFSLRAQTLLLFLGVGLLPVGLATTRLIGVNQDAIVQGEQKLQVSVLAEVSGDARRAVSEARGDVEAIANALSFAAKTKAAEEDETRAVHALLGTRKAIDAYRLEVPSANVSVVASRPGVDQAAVPASTEAQRRAADERNAAFEVTGPGKGVIVVPVPPASERAPAAYVTAAVDLGKLTPELDAIARQRFDGEVSLLIADGRRRAVAAFNVPEAAPGADVAALPIWKNLPERTTAATRSALVTEIVSRGVASVGAIESVDELGWTIAVWRPKPVAYATLTTMRSEGLRTGLVTLLLALIAGLAAAAAITRPILAMAAQAKLIGQRKWKELAAPSARRDELGQLSRTLGRVAVELEESEATIGEQARLRGDLSRFLSKELVEAIVRGEHPMALGGKRAAVTVLFADVVAFTPLAESRSAEQVVGVLNDLFSMLSEIVFRHHGTVDKFIGDCIMGVWGAPVGRDDHAALGLAAAEDMMRFLETANETYKKKYDLEIRLAIGVNSGEAIVGNIGSQKRMEYTVVGDVVNVAARLEAIAAPNQILIGEATARLAGEEFSLSLLGERKLTGRQNATQVFTLET